MKYFFILGRNPELSIAEIFSVMKRKGLSILDYKRNSNALILETSSKLSLEFIQELGGTISMGEVKAEGITKDIINSLEKQELYLGTKNKINYSFYDYSEDSNEILDYLKKRFKEEKLKASLKTLTGELELQNGETKRISVNRTDVQYFLFEDDKGKYFGNILKSYDHSEIERRDMEKPIRREHLAISPRLAKIMINLSEAKEDEILLDPFCGIGVVLQEALLKKLNVIGIDKDKDAIEGARKNIFPLKTGKNCVFMNKDSGKVKIPEVDVAVFEPFMGETLKKIPTQEQARKTIEETEKLVISVLNNIKKKVKTRFIFTMPYIRTIKDRIEPDEQKILGKTGLKKEALIMEMKEIEFPLPEYRKNQIVGRKIFVLKK